MVDAAISADLHFSSSLVGAKVKNSLPGRVRWSVPWLIRRTAECRAIESSLARVGGITDAEANPVTGSVLITYDRSLTFDSISEILRGALLESENSPPPLRPAPVQGPSLAEPEHPFSALFARV